MRSVSHARDASLEGESGVLGELLATQNASRGTHHAPASRLVARGVPNARGESRRPAPSSLVLPDQLRLDLLRRMILRRPRGEVEFVAHAEQMQPDAVDREDAVLVLVGEVRVAHVLAVHDVDGAGADDAEAAALRLADDRRVLV